MSAPLLAYQFSSFAGLPLVHGLSGRVVELPFQGDVGHGRGTVADDIERNRAAFLSELGVAVDALTLGRQTHGARVQVVEPCERGQGRFPAFDGFPETDALTTNHPGVALGVIVADCVPILLYDPEHHAVAVVHAGWRGTVAGIAANAVQGMAEAYETNPSTLIAGIGPSIGPCCYEVGDEVIAAWCQREDVPVDDAVRRVDSSYHFDLWAANLRILTAAGVREDRIELSGVCVRCGIERYFSYRASGQGVAHPGRMLMVAQLQPLA
ncbi:MAG: peptidoglycan editing factor PgeF [Chloroflexota bacterium]|nr:peptidoglycan editing factor PgeF [Chloroflexota bacterium]